MGSAEIPRFEIPVSTIRELEELERLAREGIAAVPPPGFIAEFVRLQRAMLGWKQQTLASFAGVSLSTVERIERGDLVSAASLDRVAVVLGQRPGAFTEPRIPLCGEQLEQKANASTAVFKDRVWASVRPLRTQPQIAALARTHVQLIDASRLGDSHDEEVAALREHLGFVGYVLETANEDLITGEEPLKRRELYGMVLHQVKAIEKHGNAVALAGTYNAETNARIMPTVDVGLIVFFPRSSDPAAVKRRSLLAPAKLDLTEAWKRFCRTDDN